MKKLFGVCNDGRQAHLYTIQGGGLTAEITELGATLVKLFVPDDEGALADVVLGFDHPDGYLKSESFPGCTVGRCANRIGGARFTLNGKEYQLDANDNEVNCLHSGFAPFKDRLFEVKEHTENSVCFYLFSPDGDQGFPGNAEIYVTYSLEAEGILRIAYDAVADKDTVFNFTNHTYFNLAGHDKPEKSLQQVLSMPGRQFVLADNQCIPTGEMMDVDGTIMDFRVPKPVGQDLDLSNPLIAGQDGYDHDWEAFCNPCAILSDSESGRTMSVYTDCPAIHMYDGGCLADELGKDGAVYSARSGVALETQYYPDALNKPHWAQPVTKAGQRYHSVTEFRFT